MFISVPLAQRHRDLLRMRSLWKTNFVSEHRYESHIHHATSLASEILGEVSPQPLSWLFPKIAPISLEEDDWQSDHAPGDDGDDRDDITGDLIAEALEGDENQDQPPSVTMSWQVPVSSCLVSCISCSTDIPLLARHQKR
jgi:hypothetical protein